MATRARWHTEALPDLDDAPDPFAVPIEEVGQRFDLRDPQVSLQLRLTELVGREGSLFNAGVRCEIKDRPDSCCHACPVSEAADRQAALGTLCRIGREQEAISTELAVRSCRGPEAE